MRKTTFVFIILLDRNFILVIFHLKLLLLLGQTFILLLVFHLILCALFLILPPVDAMFD